MTHDANGLPATQIMIDAQDFTRLFDQLPAGFPVDQSAATDAWKIWGTFGERFSGIALEAAAKSNDIATGSANETFSRLGDVTKVREEPSEYAQAVAHFAQAQFDLSRRMAEAFAGVMQKAQSDTSELVTTTGQRVTESGSATTEAPTDTTTTKTKKVAKAAK